MAVPLHSSVPYSAIIDRPKRVLADGRRLIVWTIVNVENWSISGSMPRVVLPPPMGESRLPDIANWAWHEYGLRVGFWRFTELFARLGIKPTLAINGAACADYPRIVEAALKGGWEFMGHGFEQAPMHTLDDQAGAIERTIAAITAASGRAPRGWESPGLTQTFETAGLLAKAGIEYTADFVIDDQPCEVQTAAGRILALPYTVELNDVVLHVVQQQPSDTLLRRGLDQFKRLYAESAQSTRVMTVTVHPYLMGAPHRIGYLDALYERLAEEPGVAFMTGGEILDWWRG